MVSVQHWCRHLCLGVTETQYGYCESPLHKAVRTKPGLHFETTRCWNTKAVRYLPWRSSYIWVATQREMYEKPLETEAPCIWDRAVEFDVLSCCASVLPSLCSHSSLLECKWIFCAIVVYWKDVTFFWFYKISQTRDCLECWKILWTFQQCRGCCRIWKSLKWLNAISSRMTRVRIPNILQEF